MNNYLNNIICGDSIQLIKQIESDSIHIILSDIPYGISKETWDVLHSNTNSALLGSSPAQKQSSIFKTRGKPLNGWSDADKQIPYEYYTWCKSWSDDWFRVMKPCGSVFIFAGRRFAHRCICAMEDSGFILKDIIAWIKNKAPHRAQAVSSVFERQQECELANKWQGWKLGNLRPIYEPILWFVKPYKVGTTITNNIELNELGAYKESAFDIPNNLIKVSNNKNDTKFHPTQKPLILMQKLIELVTIENQIVLDPFAGSGTTLLAAKNLNRQYIGIEQEEKYCQTAKQRLEKIYD